MRGRRRTGEVDETQRFEETWQLGWAGGSSGKTNPGLGYEGFVMKEIFRKAILNYGRELTINMWQDEERGE